VNKDMTFGEMLVQLKAGQCALRKGWNGKEMWLKYVPGFQGKGHDSPGGSRFHAPWIGMKTAQNEFVPWLASQTDTLAKDWQLQKAASLSAV